MIDNKAEQNRELFAYFGLAIYHAQCIERQLAILLAVKPGIDTQEFFWQEFDRLCSFYFRKTLGSLIETMKVTINIPKDLEISLQGALDTRNWLVHNFFWDRAVDILKEEGREMMINELRELSEGLNAIDDKFVDITNTLVRKLGVTEDVIQETLEKMLEARR